MASLFYKCSSCSAAFAVDDEDPDIGLLRPIMGCVHAPRCGGKLRVTDTAGSSGVLLSAKALFTNSEGGGVPEERQCGTESVGAAMLGKRITKMNIASAGQDKNRCIINSIDLEDGTTIVLAASVLGATVSKIMRKKDAPQNPR